MNRKETRMRSVQMAATLIVFSFSTMAQQPARPASSKARPAQPPFQAKRLPPEKAAAVAATDMAAQLSAIQDAVPSTDANPDTSASGVFVPRGYKPKTDVQLNKTAQDAVQMSAKWTGKQNQPLAGEDGRVLYSYGAGLPTVVCAPLRVCIIELQPGEKLSGEPQIGDSVRWNVSPAMYGHGASATTLIVLKPQISGLDTNLLITTDRRAYYLRLVSKPKEYVARVAFAYPADESDSKWQAQIARPSAQEQANTATTPPTNLLGSLCFDYRIKGKHKSLRPVRVFDDGQKTFIQMSRRTQARELPALVVLGHDGKQEMVNYRVKGDTYIVDRLFDRAELILGAGKRAEKVKIERERKN